MKGQTDIQRRIDEAMDSLSDIKAVDSNPFLFEKIKDRMNAETEPVESPLVLHSPALRIAAVFLLLILNGWFIGIYGFSSSAGSEMISDTDVEYIIESYEINTGNISIYN